MQAPANVVLDNATMMAVSRSLCESNKALLRSCCRCRATSSERCPPSPAPWSRGNGQCQADDAEVQSSSKGIRFSCTMCLS